MPHPIAPGHPPEMSDEQRKTLDAVQAELGVAHYACRVPKWMRRPCGCCNHVEAWRNRVAWVLDSLGWDVEALRLRVGVSLDATRQLWHAVPKEVGLVREEFGYDPGWDAISLWVSREPMRGMLGVGTIRGADLRERTTEELVQQVVKQSDEWSAWTRGAT